MRRRSSERRACCPQSQSQSCEQSASLLHAGTAQVASHPVSRRSVFRWHLADERTPSDESWSDSPKETIKLVIAGFMATIGRGGRRTKVMAAEQSADEAVVAWKDAPFERSLSMRSLRYVRHLRYLGDLGNQPAEDSLNWVSSVHVMTDAHGSSTYILIFHRYIRQQRDP